MPVPIPPGYHSPGIGNTKLNTSAQDAMKKSSFSFNANEGMNFANMIAGIGSSLAAATNTNAAYQMAMQQQSANQAMQFNSEEAEKNRQFQKMMSDTAYQRMVADLKKAGLNPILAMGTGGASTPNGSSANGIAINGAAGKVSDAASLMMIAPAALSAFSSVANSAITALEKNPTYQRAEKLFDLAGKAFDKMEGTMSNWLKD